MQLTIDDITENYHRGNAESAEANKTVDKARLRLMVLGAVRILKGATSDEVEQMLNLPHQTVSARMTELKALGLIKPSGEKRKTRSGRNAVVLI